MLKSKGFIFTNKKHTEKGIMSAILGVLANITMGTAVYFSYLGGGVSSPRYAAAALLADLESGLPRRQKSFDCLR